MSPTIQLIQMTLQVEREVEAQRRSDMTYSSDGADEKSVRSSKQEKRILGDVNVPRRRPQCECA
jgi:hypothetical protein